jgi:hypothetical protein
MYEAHIIIIFPLGEQKDFFKKGLSVASVAKDPTNSGKSMEWGRILNIKYS